jgi:GNAT superfamily N-acetyltransferase
MDSAVDRRSGRLAMLIRALDPTEVGELVTLQRAAFVRDAQLYGDPFLSSLTQTVDEIDAELQDPRWSYLGAWIGHRLVGSVRSHIESGAVMIGRLMCAPDLEGRGIGTALLDAAERDALALASVVELRTGSKSAANLAMYERRGYRVVAESVGGADWSVVTMRKTLRSAGAA